MRLNALLLRVEVGVQRLWGREAVRERDCEREVGREGEKYKRNDGEDTGNSLEGFASHENQSQS